MAIAGEDCSIELVSIGPFHPNRGYRMVLTPIWPWHVICCYGYYHVDEVHPRLTVIGRLGDHISSVRSLASCTSSCHEGHRLLFSGGGRASLKAWTVNPGSRGIEACEIIACRISSKRRHCVISFSSHFCRLLYKGGVNFFRSV